VEVYDVVVCWGRAGGGGSVSTLSPRKYRVWGLRFGGRGKYLVLS
jgi:hypothetical protein